MSEGADISTELAIVIALASGFFGSMFGVVGSFVITLRVDFRQRRARLKALEHELRGNRLVIEDCQAGRAPPGQLSDAMWTRLQVDLALDVHDKTYEKLQSYYWLFTDTERACAKMSRGEADGQEVKKVNYSHELCHGAQALVTGELDTTWRALMWNGLKRLITGKEVRQSETREGQAGE